MTRSVLAAALAAIPLALAGCTGAGSILEPSALLSPQPPSAAASTIVQFAPVVGAPGPAAGILGEALLARAGEVGLNLAMAGETGTLSMQGYFSAFSEDGGTTVVYVWDVVDPGGNRVHRIQGSQQAAAGPGEGWDGVDEATMRTIAGQTIDQLVGWIALNDAG